MEVVAIIILEILKYQRKDVTKVAGRDMCERNSEIWCCEDIYWKKL